MNPSAFIPTNEELTLRSIKTRIGEASGIGNFVYEGTAALDLIRRSMSIGGGLELEIHCERPYGGRERVVANFVVTELEYDSARKSAKIRGFDGTPGVTVELRWERNVIYHAAGKHVTFIVSEYPPSAFAHIQLQSLR